MGKCDPVKNLNKVRSYKGGREGRFGDSKQEEELSLTPATPGYPALHSQGLRPLQYITPLSLHSDVII